MTWVAVGVAGASVVSGAIGANASKKAAGAQERATLGQTAEQRRQYEQTREDQGPFQRTGVAANQRLATLLGLDVPSGAITYKGQQFESADALRNIFRKGHVDQFGSVSSPENDAAIEAIIANETQPVASASGAGQSGYGDLTRRFAASDLEADPVYQSGLQFGLDEGRGAINARAIAGGGYDSGATLKALTRFGTDYGTTKAEGAYNRFTGDQNNIYNKLAGVSGAGQVATNQVQTAGTNAANATSQALGDAGNARAAGIVGGANAWNSALGGVANAAQGYQTNKQLMALLAKRNAYPAYNASVGGA